MSLFRQLSIFLAVAVAAACFSMPALASDGADTVSLGESVSTVGQNRDKPEKKKSGGGSRVRVKMIRQDVRYNDEIVRSDKTVEEEDQNGSMQDKDIRSSSDDLVDESHERSYWCYEIQMEMVMQIILDEEEGIEEQEINDMQDGDADQGSSSSGADASGAENSETAQTAPDLDIDSPVQEEPAGDEQEAAPSADGDGATAENGNSDISEPEKKPKPEKEPSDQPEKPDEPGKANDSEPTDASKSDASDGGGQDTAAAGEE